jgi:hypothetical protein
MPSSFPSDLWASTYSASSCQGIRHRPFSSSFSIFSKFPQATQSNLPHTPRAWALLDLSSPVRPSNNLVNPILASHRPAPRHGVDTNIASCLCKPDAAALITGRRLLRHRRHAGMVMALERCIWQATAAGGLLR